MSGQEKNFYHTEESRWAAVAARDQGADKHFYYGVQTTGVYCRPGCSSRLPNRQNVVFFNTPMEAESAGYRPCRRCRPGADSADARTGKIIIASCRAIEQAGKPIKLADLAAEAGLSRYHFHRLFKKMVGLTPRQYGSTLQAKRFRGLLRSGCSVTRALYGAGFGSSSRLYEKSGEDMAMQPRVYKNGGSGITIHYDAVRCFLGWVMVAVTERGICGVDFGDNPEALQVQLRDRFPRADLERGGPGFAALIETVISFVEQPRAGLHLPLDIQGTVFQQRVWQTLRQIKPGCTASYTDIAEAIGNPKAVRAVAKACAANRIAVLIPCHRVVHQDGRPGGYRWGVKRKERLLALEKEG